MTRRTSRKRSSRTLCANGRPRVNREGLTFEEWYAAAGRPAPVVAGTKALVAAWDACEDPTDYRVQLHANSKFDTVYYWNDKWRAAAPLPPPLGKGETLAEMKSAIERSGYIAVLGAAAYGAPKTPPWRLQRNSKKTDAEAEAKYKVEADRRRERDRAEKAQYAEIRRFTDEVERTLLADGGANQFQVYYRPGHLHLVRVGDRPNSNLKLAWQEPLSGFLGRDQRARLITDRLARVSWLGPDMIEREIVAAPAKQASPLTEYRGFTIEKHEPLVGKPFYELHYPEGGGSGKTVSTLKAARAYIDEYMGDT
jgi:hypothetical protein